MLQAYLILLAIAGGAFLLWYLYNRWATPPVIEPLLAEGEGGAPIEMTSEAQFVEAVHAEGLTLVDFYATWCGPCNAMHPTIEKISAMGIKGLKVVKVDIDYLRSVAGLYRVRSVPTLILFKNGDLLWRYSGVAGFGELKTAISQFQEKA